MEAACADVAHSGVLGVVDLHSFGQERRPSLDFSTSDLLIPDEIHFLRNPWFLVSRNTWFL